MKTVKKIEMSCGGQGCNVPTHTKLTGYDKKIKQPEVKTSKIIS
jgi:hypothetical protein